MAKAKQKQGLGLYHTYDLGPGLLLQGPEPLEAPGWWGTWVEVEELGPG